jgi:tetratricopeptide (TPR) repeat protein
MAVVAIVAGLLLPTAGLACDPVPIRALEADRWQLQIAPHERAWLWIVEQGSDIRIETAQGAIDSAPGRHALEPVAVSADADGLAELVLVRTGGAEPARLSARRRCGIAARPLANRLVDRLARQRAALADGGPIMALQATITATAGLALSGGAGELHGWFLLQAASLARGAGFMGEAAALYRRAADVLSSEGDLERTAWAELGEAQALLRLGSPLSEQALADAARAADTAGLPFAAAIARHDTCVWQRTQGDLELAQVCFDGVASEYDLLGEPRERALANFNRAMALQMLGQYGEARNILDMAAAAGPASDHRHRHMAALVRAQLARWSGDFERSLALLEEALGLAEEHANPLDQAHALRLIGNTYAVSGEPKRALDYYERALVIYRQRGVDGRAAAVEATMAHVLEGERRVSEALPLLEAAGAVLSESGTATEAAAVRVDLARVQAASGQHAAAAATLDGVFEQAGVLSWKRLAEARALRLSLSPPERLEQAEAELSPLLDEARQNGHFLLHLELAGLLVEQRLRFGAAEAALALADAGLRLARPLAASLRSPGLRHAVLRRARPLAMARFGLLDEGAVDAGQASAAVAELERLRQVERAAVGRAGSDELDELERWLTAEALQTSDSIPAARRHALVLALDGAGPDRDPATEAAGEFVASRLPELAAGEYLLYPALGEHRGGLLIGSHDGWRWHRVDPVVLRAAVAGLYDLLAAGHGDGDRLVAALAEAGAALRWGSVFGLAPRRLMVVADADLAGLPWDLLPLPGAAGETAGSGIELVLLQSLQSGRMRPPRELFALAASPPPGLTLAVLEGARREAAMVEGHWRQHLPVGRAPADRDGLATVLGRDGAIVHVAAHGRADRGYAEEAGLWLLDEAGDSVRFLSALRLRQLPQRSSLVVLGACEGARAVAATSLGIGGVAGSIIDAGGQAVISTLWPVSDRAAMIFADEFHAALARAPASPAAALLEAKRRLRGRPAFRHPSHWAGWVLLQAGPPGMPER